MNPLDSDSWSKPWPLGVSLFGLVILVLAVVGTFTGKAYGRGGLTSWDGPSEWFTLRGVEHAWGDWFPSSASRQQALNLSTEFLNDYGKQDSALDYPENYLSPNPCPAH